MYVLVGAVRIFLGVLHALNFRAGYSKKTRGCVCTAMFFVSFRFIHVFFLLMENSPIPEL